MRILAYCLLITFGASLIYSQEPAWADPYKSRYEEATRASKVKVSNLSYPSQMPGKKIDTLPRALLGEWGGRLKIYRYDATKLYKAMDASLAQKSIDHLKPGRTCSINFNFIKGSDGKITLLTSPGIVMIPALSSQAVQSQLRSLRRTKSEAEVSMLKSMMSEKWMPIQIDFEASQTTSEKVSVAGGHHQSKVFLDSIYELDDGVFERQLLLDSTTYKKGSKVPNKRICETLFWLKMLPGKDYIYVRICGLEGNCKGSLLNRLVIAGNLVRGKHVETNAKLLMKHSFGLP